MHCTRGPMEKKINKHFVSAIDQFLVHYDQTHAPSTSQQAEIQKYRDISKRRDLPTDVEASGVDETLWA